MSRRPQMKICKKNKEMRCFIYRHKCGWLAQVARGVKERKLYNFHLSFSHFCHCAVGWMESVRVRKSKSSSILLLRTDSAPSEKFHFSFLLFHAKKRRDSQWFRSFARFHCAAAAAASLD
jgi:hypothetical protein